MASDQMGTEIRPDDHDRTLLLRALVAFAFVLLVGTVGFIIIEEDWGVWKSLFFTVITISTVGYGDHGISEAGQRFAAVLILLGIGTCTYALGQLVQMAVGRRLAWRQRMQQQIDRLRDHFIVCGIGRVGQSVCERFNEAGMPVVVIEADPSRTQWARDHGHWAIDGSCTEDEALLQAGVKHAKGIVCCTGIGQPDDRRNPLKKGYLCHLDM